MIRQSGLSIGTVIQNAIAFDFKHLAERSVNLDALPQLVDDLLTLLAARKIDHVLVGGIAMLQYVEGRNTEDIDLIMPLASLKRLPELQIEQQDKNFARGRFQGLQIDLLLTSNRLFDTVRQRFSAHGRFDERAIPVATVEGLLLLKLYALPSLYRQGNFARVALYEGDIITLMQAYSPAMEPLLNELTHHLSGTDMAEVRTIVAELQQRIERFRRSFGRNE